jgi:uncharacterized protein (UPF0218 family)
MLLLPEDKRSQFRKPFGALFPDIGAVLPEISGKTVYSVGDVVTYHLIRNGVVPAVAIVDGHTMREPFDHSPAVFRRRLSARNPAGTLTSELRDALQEAVAAPDVLILVEGEEDLAVIPLVLAAPMGAIILYGQPGQGIVLCEVNEKAKKKAREMLSEFVETGDC